MGGRRVIIAHFSIRRWAGQHSRRTLGFPEERQVAQRSVRQARQVAQSSLRQEQQVAQSSLRQEQQVVQSSLRQEQQVVQSSQEVGLRNHLPTCQR